MGASVAETPQKEVDVCVKTVGPGRPTILRVQSPVKVYDLRRMIAAEKDFPPDRLKLVLRGQALIDKHGEAGDAFVKLQDNDTIMAAVMPKAPSNYLREGYDEDEDELKFQIPESASFWKKKIFYFLKQKLRMPDILLMAMFSISLKTWIGITLWFLLAPVAHKWDLGPIYILGTGFSIILLNLGRRQHGDASAYSIFNEDFRELPGTLNADRVDRDIRAGQI